MPVTAIKCGQCKRPIIPTNVKVVKYENRSFCNGWCLNLYKHIRNDHCCVHVGKNTGNIYKITEELNNLKKYLKENINFYDEQIKDSKDELLSYNKGVQKAQTEILKKIQKITTN